MSLNAALHIAATGLIAQQKKLAVTTHNIANAGTPEYVRRELPLSELAYGGAGAGVRAGPERRAADPFALGDLLGKTAAAEDLAARQPFLDRLDALAGGPGRESVATLTARLESAYAELEAAPESRGAQNAVVGTAQRLAAQFREAGDAFASLRGDLEHELAAGVAGLNRDLAALAELNRRAAGGDLDAADARDGVLTAIAGAVDVNLQRAADGSVTVSSKNGRVLRPGLTADDLAGVSGGRLGGLLAVRDGVLPGFAARFDGLAQQTARRFEAQGLTLFTGATAAALRANPAVDAERRLARDGDHPMPGFTPNPPDGPQGFTGLAVRVREHAFGRTQASGAPWPGGQTLFEIGRDLATDLADAAGAVGGALASARAGAESAAGRLRDRVGVNLDRETVDMLSEQRAYEAAAKAIVVNQQMWSALEGLIR